MTDIGSFFSDQDYLFLQNIYNPHSTMQGQDLSTFAVKRDIFMSFFPEFPDDLDMTDPISHRSVNPETETEAFLPTEAVGAGPMTIAGHDDTDMSQEPLGPTGNHPATEQAQDISPLQLHVPPSLSGDIGSMNALVPANQVPEPSHQELVSFDTTPRNIEAETQASPSLLNYALGSIKWQTLDACTYSTTLSPKRFYALFHGRAQESIPYGTFYHIDTKEILCLLCSSVDKLPDLLPELGNHWFAKATDVSEAGQSLKLLPVEDVVSFLKRGPDLFFLGVGGGAYNSDILNIDTGVSTAEHLVLPQFNSAEKRWELKALESRH